MSLGANLFATWPHVQHFGFYPRGAVGPEDDPNLERAMTLLTVKDRLERIPEIQ